MHALSILSIIIVLSCISRNNEPTNELSTLKCEPEKVYINLPEIIEANTIDDFAIKITNGNSTMLSTNAQDAKSRIREIAEQCGGVLKIPRDQLQAQMTIPGYKVMFSFENINESGDGWL